MWSFQIFGYEFFFLFYTFLIYGVVGWIYESCLVSVQKRKWVNRGFLNGPLIPIYGAAGTLIYMCLTPVRQHPALVFLGGMAVASALEFVTSYVMEKLFHAKWWDYSHYRFNLQGRICLLASLFWGFLSLVLIDFLQPLVTELIHRIPRKQGELAGYVLLVLFLTDLTVTVISTVKMDRAISAMNRVREELKAYIESTRLYEAKEEWKLRFEQNSMVEWAASVKKVLAERLEELGGGKEEQDDRAFGKEIEERMKRYLDRYFQFPSPKHWIQKRLLKAFPNMKSEQRQAAFQEFRSRMLEKKKKDGADAKETDEHKGNEVNYDGGGKRKDG